MGEWAGEEVRFWGSGDQTTSSWRRASSEGSGVNSGSGDDRSIGFDCAEFAKPNGKSLESFWVGWDQSLGVSHGRHLDLPTVLVDDEAVTL